MKQDLTTNPERLHGLKRQPYIIYSRLWRRRPQTVSHEEWQRTLSLREAHFFGLGVFLLALATAGICWLFAANGWIR